MRSVLAMIDFSEYSSATLHAAHHYCNLSGARLHIFHKAELIVPAFADNDFKKAMSKELEEKALEELQEFVKRTLQTDPARFDLHVTSGKLLSRLAELIQEHQFDLAFFGAKKRSMFMNMVLGSTILKVIDEFELPIAVIPPHYIAVEPFTFFVAVGEEYPLNRASLLKLLNGLKGHVACVEFFNISKDKANSKMQQHLEELTTVFTDISQCNYKIQEGDNVHEELKNFMIRQRSGVLVLQRGSRDFQDVVLRKSMVNALVYDSEIPLLILP